MIPLQLYLSGFLSYRDPVEIDFTGFDLACISGVNGAGKSSLLDAITWALFGQARKRDDTLVNNQCDGAEVRYTFAYEGNYYRVSRAMPRGKTSRLEFWIRQDLESGETANAARPTANHQPSVWKPLTGHTQRDTQERIQKTLRMDYDTFVNASFFLQGKADQFAQRSPGERKKILGSVLGLEVWEEYRQRVVARLRAVEVETRALEGRLQEVNAELAEEDIRRASLKGLETELKRLVKARSSQEKALESLRKLAATLAEQRKFVEMLKRGWQATSQQAEGIQGRLQARLAERQAFDQVIARAGEIEAAYAAWQAQRAELENWEEIASRFRDQQTQRQAPLMEIEAERARLTQEQQSLLSQQTAIDHQQSLIVDLQAQLSALSLSLAQAEADLEQRAILEGELQAARQRQVEAQAGNRALKERMDELKTRIDSLSEVEGAACPLCGQPLSPDDRHRLIADLKSQGKDMGDSFRANKNLLEEAERSIKELASKVRALEGAESAYRSQADRRARLEQQRDQLIQSTEEWRSLGAARLEQVRDILEQESFSQAARVRLAEVDAALKAIGYDAAAHDALRRAEVASRAAEADLRELEKARLVLEPLGREIDDLNSQLAGLAGEVARQEAEYTAAESALTEAQAQAPDLKAAERGLLDLQEAENRLRMEVGGARQKVEVLAGLKNRRKELDEERERLARLSGQFKQLERAFSKDGVPALLIEQALPQIENKANSILERLSDGIMTVRFVTQAAFKDPKRENLRETLEIQISDSAGPRDYELYSGGEAFRVNFAIRLALSEVLAQRAGARLQMLVIDEGFGSQDAQGRQRLVEAINLVRQEFAKILVITHIEELKDVFPTRIEVEKTARGSTVRVI